MSVIFLADELYPHAMLELMKLGAHDLIRYDTSAYGWRLTVAHDQSLIELIDWANLPEIHSAGAERLLEIFTEQEGPKVYEFRDKVMGAHRKLQEWRKENDHMQRTFTITVKCDFKDGERYAAIKEVVRDAAQSIYSLAVMLADSKPPAISIKSEDLFEGTEDIKLTK